MADETTAVGTPDAPPSEQGTTVPELETTSQGNNTETLTLPSDVEAFTIPEKFAGKSAEEIAKAYVELEKMRASGETPPPAPSGDTPPPEAPPAEAPTTKYYDEFIESGTLSDESYAELEAQGHSKAEVDDRFGYEQYKQTQRIDTLTKGIGGAEEYQKLEAWAVDNVSDDDRANFTQEFTSASDFAKKAMLENLYSQYKAGTGETSPDVVHTNESQYAVTKGYTSQHELQADMANPLYGKDRSYTQAVEAKLAKSKQF